MSPTIVLDGAGNLELVTGSPGGSAIIGYTAQSIVNVLDFGLDAQQAVTYLTTRTATAPRAWRSRFPA